MKIEEIKFGCLRPSDRISIHTANSIYEFSVTDPSSHTGILRGGSLGETAIIARLLGCAPEQRKSDQLPKLSVGAKALFLCVSTKGIRRLVTSQVRRLFYTREHQAEKTFRSRGSLRDEEVFDDAL